MLNRISSSRPAAKGAILAACGIWLWACTPERVDTPPDGGKAAQPFGELLMCAENPDHVFCKPTE